MLTYLTLVSWLCVAVSVFSVLPCLRLHAIRLCLRMSLVSISMRVSVPLAPVTCCLSSMEETRLAVLAPFSLLSCWYASVLLQCANFRLSVSALSRTWNFLSPSPFLSSSFFRYLSFTSLVLSLPTLALCFLFPSIAAQCLSLLHLSLSSHSRSIIS